MFLKYLDALEQDRADEAALEGKVYSYILAEPFRWESWAAPKGTDGQLDHNQAVTGDDLVEFVNDELVPYLNGFKLRASGPNTIEYKIGEIFGEIKNKVSSGYNLREIIDHIDELRFRSQKEKHELSHLYEARLQRAGRQTGDVVTRLEKRTLSRARASRLGVSTHPPVQPNASQRCWSVMMKRMFGRLTEISGGPR